MSLFLDPSSIVAQIGLLPGQTVADLGCGSGYYVTPAAQLVGQGGIIYAVDVQQDMLAVTISSTSMHGLRNVRVVQADLEKPLTAIPESSCDAVIIGSVLHQTTPEPLLKNAYRILKTGGKLLAVEWKKGLTIIGPPQQKRIDQETLEHLLETLGLRKLHDIATDRSHYAVLFSK